MLRSKKLGFWQKAAQSYRRIFSIAEIESDTVLQWCLGFLLVSLFINFASWQSNTFVTVAAIQNHIAACWPFFPNCTKWYFLNLPPYGYSQVILFSGFFLTLGAAAYFMYCKKWVAAHACMLTLYLARFYFMLATILNIHNYWLYVTYFGFIFLCIPHKKFFARLMVVMCYFLASSSKIYESWTLGTYFTSMQMGLPLIPRGWEIIFSNIVIFMEMAASWFLFSGHRILQRSVLVFFILFHAYSSTLVNYLFPSIILPLLIMLFLPQFTPYKSIPLDNRSAVGWSFMACLLFLQLVPVLIHGDDKYTEEGTYTSLSMLIANHQCRAQLLYPSGQTFKISYSDGPEDYGVCQVYPRISLWQSIYCPTSARRPLRYIVDYSLNGRPFYRIIDVPDFCALTYKYFSHNTWIKDSKTAPIVGYPRKGNSVVNYFKPSVRIKEGFNINVPGRALPDIVTADTVKNDRASLTYLQKILDPYNDTLCILWRCLWVGLLVYMVSRFIILPSLKK